jgi:diguanylate cyclase (GGDEF)-like protein
MHIYFDGVDVITPLLLAVMATVGYVFGTLAQRKNTGNKEVLLRLQKDVSRAKMAVSELEKVICAVRSSTDKHYSRLRKFRNRIAKLGTQQGDAVWDDLCREVEGILDPTLQLVGEIANAQDRIRYQSNHLMTFSEMRTDPLTGLGNRRALDHVLSTQCGILTRYGIPFSMAVVDIDHFKTLNDQNGHQYGDQMLCDLKELLLGSLRTVDIVARYGGDEFVVVMPQTDIAGATTLGERMRLEVDRELPFTVSVGVATANDADTPESLFKRADAALYRAKTGGRNCIWSDHGETCDAVVQAEPCCKSP